MYKLLITCIMLFGGARMQSMRLSRSISSRLSTASRLGAASMSSFQAHSLHQSRRAQAFGLPSSVRYCSIRNFSVASSDNDISINALKSELCYLIDFKGNTVGDNSAAIVEQLMDFYKRRQTFPKGFLVNLLDHSLKHQLTLPNILPVYRNINADDEAVFDGNLTVVGDVHGQYDDFAQIFQKPELGGYPSENNQFIFNGDLVDRGPMALEIVTVLLVCKLLNINSVHILRGNHETHSMTQAFGFEKEVLRKYDFDLLTKFRTLFDALPVAAVVENKIFVVHGGIGPQVVNMTIEDINALDRVGEPDYSGPISELLWSDPKDKLKGFRANKGRGGGTVCFGDDVTRAFLMHNDLQLVIRSHEVMMAGFETFHDGLCWSVFSAPNYCGETGNLGALVKFNQKDSMEASIVQFRSVVPMPLKRGGYPAQ